RAARARPGGVWAVRARPRPGAWLDRAALALPPGPLRVLARGGPAARAHHGPGGRPRAARSAVHRPFRARGPQRPVGRAAGGRRAAGRRAGGRRLRRDRVRRGDPRPARDRSGAGRAALPHAVTPGASLHRSRSQGTLACANRPSPRARSGPSAAGTKTALPARSTWLPVAVSRVVSPSSPSTILGPDPGTGRAPSAGSAVSPS